MQPTIEMEFEYAYNVWKKQKSWLMKQLNR